jgi:hypothetical protein
VAFGQFKHNEPLLSIEKIQSENRLLISPTLIPGIGDAAMPFRVRAKNDDSLHTGVLYHPPSGRLTSIGPVRQVVGE